MNGFQKEALFRYSLSLSFAVPSDGLCINCGIETENEVLCNPCSFLWEWHYLDDLMERRWQMMLFDSEEPTPWLKIPLDNPFIIE